MENLLIEMLIPPEIQAGLKLGNYILNGGMILKQENNSPVMLVNESAETKIFSPAALGMNPAMVTLTLTVAAGFLYMNSKLDKIQNQLQDIKTDLTEVKKIIKDMQEYEVGKLFADFKTYLQEAKLNVAENKTKNLLTLRREFLKIENRVETLITMIQNQGKIIFLRNTLMQYIKLYHACAESSIRCSMAGKEYSAAYQLVADSVNFFDDLQEKYCQAFLTASANEISRILYDEILGIKQNYFQISFMRDCIKSDEKIIDCLKQKKFTYIGLDKKMQELQTIKEPAVLLLK